MRETRSGRGTLRDSAPSLRDSGAKSIGRSVLFSHLCGNSVQVSEPSTSRSQPRKSHSDTVQRPAPRAATAGTAIKRNPAARRDMPAAQTLLGAACGSPSRRVRLVPPAPVLRPAAQNDPWESFAVQNIDPSILGASDGAPWLSLVSQPLTREFHDGAPTILWLALALALVTLAGSWRSPAFVWAKLAFTVTIILVWRLVGVWTTKLGCGCAGEETDAIFVNAVLFAFFGLMFPFLCAIIRPRPTVDVLSDSREEH